MAGCGGGGSEADTEHTSVGGTPGPVESPVKKITCTSSSTSLLPAASLVGDGTIGLLSGSRDGSDGRGSSRGSSVGGPASKRVPVREVPTGIHRRAAQLVERFRGTPAAPDWEAARLSDVAYPFYRPDLNGVAYYEIEVDPGGFVVLSTGPHDFPIAHWNYTGPSLGRRLEAAAEEANQTVGRRYKLDTLSYAVEDEAGETSVFLGQPVFEITGMRMEWLEEEPRVSATTVAPRQPVESDADVDEDLEYVVEDEGPEVEPVELEPWESWPALKAGYADSYAVVHAGLRRAAAPEWDVYERHEEQGIEIDSPTRLALLQPEADVVVRGPGEDFVRVTVVDRDGLSPVVEIVPVEPVDEPVGFTVILYYPEGEPEEVRFLLTGSEQRNGLLPTGAATLGAGVLGRQSGSGSGTTTYCEAGTSMDQRRYRSYSMGDCTVAPGAVAWALLYGWADHQACLDDPRWTNRWGLYRQSGGEHPSPDANAPDNQTPGIESVLDELHDLTGVCVDGEGSTNPVEMKGSVGKYIQNRSASAVDARLGSNPLIQIQDLAEIARGSICDAGTPAVVGANTGYALAWKYYETGVGTKFYVNAGGDGTADGWIPAGSTTYCGILCPTPRACSRLVS